MNDTEANEENEGRRRAAVADRTFTLTFAANHLDHTVEIPSECQPSLCCLGYLL